MLYFREADVRSVLSMREAIRCVRTAFEEMASGRGQNQPRRRLVMPGGSVLHSLAGSVGGYFGTKIYSTNPRHGAHFLFVLYREEDAAPLAIFEANHLGQIRTGAATGVATDVLAKHHAQTVGIIGSGFQAQTQLEAVAAVRKLKSARVWSRSAEKRQRFAVENSERFEIPVQAADTAAEAVSGADIVVTATNSKEPVLKADWIAPATHVNAIGSNNPKRRELPPELIERAVLVAVDSMEQAKLESGDLILALNEKTWCSPKLVELGSLLSGKIQAVEEGGITIFKSNGLGIEDVAAAAYVYENAPDEGRIPLPLFHS